MMENSCYFIILVAVSLCLCNAKTVVTEIDGRLDELQSEQVSIYQQVMITYNLGHDGPELEDRTLTFDISSEDARNDRPIIITITSGATVQQVKLPQTVALGATSYSQTSVTLCLVNSTLDLKTSVIVDVTANSSPEPLLFNITAHMFDNYTLIFGEKYNEISVAPAAPVSYRFEFPSYHEQPELDAVLVRVDSPDDRCSVLSIQQDACPINNREDDIKFRGTYQTFSRQAAITVPRTQFSTESFFIVVAVLSTDDDCEPTLPMIAWHISNIRHDYTAKVVRKYYNGWQPLKPSQPREKKFSIYLEKIASKTDIITGIIAALSVFVTGSLICLLITFTVTRKRLRMMIHEKENRGQQGGMDEERTQLIRPLMPTSSTPSVRSYGATAAEVVVRPGTSNTTQNVSAIADEEDAAAVGDISPIGATNADVTSDDSSVDSSDFDKLPELTYDKELIRTKIRLHVSDLSTKQPRDLAKKYLLYPWNLGIISFFYVLPVVQLVLAYQIAVIHLGNQDTCYYNFRCAVPFAGLSSFNNVFSNVAYVLLGVLFIGIVRYQDHLLRDWEYRSPRSRMTPYRNEVPLVADTPTSTIAISPATSIRQPNVALGIPPIHGISYALGIALIMEGIMSACYHVCPNSSNFQFDTTYMYILAWLLIAKIYQTRHPDIGRNAHLFYFGVAIVIFLAMLGAVFGVNSVLFYVLLFIVMVPMSFEISLYFYFMGSFKLDLSIFYRVYYSIGHMFASRSFKPNHPFRLVFVAVFITLNWGMAIFGIVTHPADFDTFLLTISISNLMLYITFYIIMKIRHRERIHPLTVILILVATAFWISAFIFFVQHETSWQLTPAESRVLNRPCILFNFFDAHDIWHFLSASALFTSFLILLVIDNEVMLVPRNEIPVF